MRKDFIINPVRNVRFTYSQLFANSKSISNSLAKKNLLEGSDVLILVVEPELLLASIISCWIMKFNPIVYSPRTDKDDLDLLLVDFSFDLIISDVDRPTLNSKTPIEKVCFDENKNINKFNFEFKSSIIALILFSSGTSGKPKAVPLSFINLNENINSFSSRLKITSNDFFLCGSPLWHAHGLYNSFLTALFLNATVIYSGQISIFNISKLFRYVQFINNCIFHITPSMIPICLSYLKIANNISVIPKFKSVICGTSFLNLESKKDFENNFKVSIFQQYGMTETLFMTINNDFNIKKPKSVGSSLENVKIEIRTDDKKLKNNNIGSVFVKTNSCFGKYYFSENDNESFLNGYFKTGDLGYFDNDDCLYITGREKDLIKKGGFSISPIKIDNLIIKIDGISDCYTLGIEDALLGEEIYTFYVSDFIFDQNQIKSVLKNKISTNLHPKSFFKIDELPKTPTGKIERTKILKTLKSLINE